MEGITLSDKYWDADSVEGKYMEVLITQEDSEEHVYWVKLSSMPEDEDEYDWPISVAIQHHNSLGLEAVSEDNAEASEPFSRNETEFTFIGWDRCKSANRSNGMTLWPSENYPANTNKNNGRVSAINSFFTDDKAGAAKLHLGI